MDRAKRNTDTFEVTIIVTLVNRRAFCVEVLPGGKMERDAVRILASVRSIFPENGKRRKSKVSLALSVNQGLVRT